MTSLAPKAEQVLERKGETLRESTIKVLAQRPEDEQVRWVNCPRAESLIQGYTNQLIAQILANRGATPPLNKVDKPVEPSMPTEPEPKSDDDDDGDVPFDLFD